MKHMFSIAIVAVLATFPAAAQSLEAAPEGRFQVEAAGERLVRIDRTTGEVAVCSEDEGAWSCAAVPGPGENAVQPASAASDELIAENARLRERVGTLEERLGSIAGLAQDPSQTASCETAVPSDTRRDIEEAVAVTDFAVRRFRDLYRSLSADEPNP